MKDRMKSVVTIRDLIGFEASGMSQLVIDGFESTDSMKNIRLNIEEQYPNANWQMIKDQLLDQVASLLNKPLHEVLARAWDHNNEVSSVIATHNDGDEQLDIVQLTDHDIKTTYNPALELNLNGEEEALLRFFLGIKLDMSDVALKVEKGEISEALSGQVNGEVILQHQNVTFVDESFSGFELSDLDWKSVQGDAVVSQEKTINKNLSMQGTGDDLKEAEESYSKQGSFVEVTKEKKRGKKGNEGSSNLMQFLLGILIAAIALGLFWLLQ